MQHGYPLPTRTHTHSLVSLGRTDRYREGTQNYIPIFSDGMTHTFVHEEDRERTMVLTRKDVWERLRTARRRWSTLSQRADPACACRPRGQERSTLSIPRSSVRRGSAWA